MISEDMLVTIKDMFRTVKKKITEIEAALCDDTTDADWYKQRNEICAAVYLSSRKTGVIDRKAASNICKQFGRPGLSGWTGAGEKSFKTGGDGDSLIMLTAIGIERAKKYIVDFGEPEGYAVVAC